MRAVTLNINFRRKFTRKFFFKSQCSPAHYAYLFLASASFFPRLAFLRALLASKEASVDRIPAFLIRSASACRKNFFLNTPYFNFNPVKMLFHPSVQSLKLITARPKAISRVLHYCTCFWGNMSK